jgi:hypothetical protein
MTSVKYTASFEIQQPVKEVFPLFSAEGEKLWVPGWNYENIMGSTELHEDYVFVTKKHDHAASNAIWVVKRYEPVKYLVQFYKVEPEEKLGIIEVQCIGQNDFLTKVQVTYEYIGLSPAGNDFIAGFSLENYEAFIGEWKTLLVRYFASKHQ